MGPGQLSLVIPGGLAALWLFMASPVAAQQPPTLPGLNEPPSGLSIPGKFVWADLFAEDVEAAKRFYAGLLGWTWRGYGSGADQVHVALHYGRPVAGLVRRPSRAPDAARSGWILYASAADPRGLAPAVERHGGATVVSPVEVPGRGTHALFRDSAGALFGVLRSATGDPADYRAETGEWVWVHLFTHEPRAAAEFYSSLLGLEVIDYMATETPDDMVLASAGHARAGVGDIGPDAPDEARPAWVGFIRVADVDATVARGEALGGRVLVRAELESLNGHAAILADDAGAVFGVMSLEFEDSESAAGDDE